MHELAIAQGILKAVDETLTAEQAVRVKRIIVTIGELNVVHKDCLEFAFTAITSGTPQDGVELVLEFVKPLFRCKSCNAQFASEDGSFTACPECGKFGVDVIAGDELYVRSVDLE